MCFRYVINSSIQTIERRFGVSAKNKLGQYAQYAIAFPGQYAPVITQCERTRLQFMQFGFTSAQYSNKILNARFEGDRNATNDPNGFKSPGILHKKSFRHAARYKRCIVVADAFILSSFKNDQRKSHVVYMKGKVRPICFAGIWSEVPDSSGQTIRSFAIVTIPANKLVRKLGCHRMPAILMGACASDWINSNTGVAMRSIKPISFWGMNAYLISEEFENHPAINSPGLLRSIGPRVLPDEFEIPVYEYEVQEILKSYGENKRRPSEDAVFNRVREEKYKIAMRRSLEDW